MKRELINLKSSKIYLDEVTKNDVIEVYTDGKRKGTICFADNVWLSILHNGNINRCDTLFEALGWWNDSKFYVD